MPLRRELLFSFAILFAVAMAIALVGGIVLLPALASPRQATLFLAALMAADLGVLFGFGSYILRQRLVRPVEGMVEDVRRMSEGGSHRIRPMASAELQAIQESVNALADRLMRDQALLAENVASLERSNAELVEARDQIVRSARLASVGTLAAGIAHEVGNPLGAVLGYADVARSRALREGHDPSLVEAIRDEAWRIDRIVRSLLDYARPDETEPAPVSARSVLEKVRELLSAQGKLDRIDHSWRFDEAAPPVFVEPSHLEQVMVNLLLNAFDAAADHPEPRLDVSVTRELGPRPAFAPRRESDPRGVDYRHRRRVFVRGRGARVEAVLAASQVVAIRIADNGPGIPEENLDRVFDPFFTTKPPGRGTGLGLAICARLAESMGGTIEAANGERGGAVFTLRLPGVGLHAGLPAGLPYGDPRNGAGGLAP